MTIGVGVVALGNAASAVIPALLDDTRVRLVGGVDPNPARRATFSARFGASAFAELDELLAAPGLDAVVIASPTFLHHEHAVRCAAAGKHVLLEKPIAANREDARAIVETARAHNRVLVVGHTHAFDAPVRAMRDLIRSGRYGAPLGVTSIVATDWLYRPRRPDELARDLGGGVVFNQGTHHVDVVRALIDDAVTGVSAVIGAGDAERGDGSYYALLRFAGGAVATLSYTGYDRFSTQELTAGLGERGERSTLAHGARLREIRALGDAVSEAQTRERLTPPPPPEAAGQPFFGLTVVSCARADIRQSAQGLYVYDETGRTEIRLPREPSHAGVVAEFIDAIAGHSAPQHDGAWALATLDVCLAMIESSDAGREVGFSLWT